MRRLAVAVVLAVVATAAIAETQDDPEARGRRDAVIRGCQEGIAQGIYVLAQLELIKIRNLVDAKEKIELECWKVPQKRVDKILNDPDRYSTSSLGAHFAADAYGIKQELRDGVYKAGIELLRKRRWRDNADETTRRLALLERQKNPSPQSSGASKPAEMKDQTPQIFIDSCVRGFEVAYLQFEMQIDPTKNLRSSNAKRCASLYDDAPTRKKFESYDWRKFGWQACIMGAEAARGQKLEIESGLDPETRTTNLRCERQGWFVRTTFGLPTNEAPSPEMEAEWAKLRDAARTVHAARK